MEAEALPYALTNTLGEIKAEMILRESAWFADQATYHHDAAKFSKGGSWGIKEHAGWQSRRGEGQKSCRHTAISAGCSTILTLAATLAKGRSQDDCQNAGRRGRQANVVAKWLKNTLEKKYNTLDHNLAEVEAKEQGNRLGDVEA